MVMPCSRSAFSPSVNSEKSIGPAPRLADARRTECTWSSNTDCESCSIRPISVLLPSSTLPAVQIRSSPDIRRPSAAPLALRPAALEVALPLLQFHRPVLVVIDDAKLPLGLARRDQLFDDLGNGVGLGADGARARRAPERTHPALHDLRLLPGHRHHERLFLDDQ